MAEAGQGDVGESFLLFPLVTLCASVSMEKCILLWFEDSRILSSYLLSQP